MYFWHMLTVSLHGIAISAARGLYAEEHKLENRFEVDADVVVATDEAEPLPFVDYTLIRRAVDDAFCQPYDTLEQFIQDIYKRLREYFPRSEKIRIAIRKLNPPMHGQTTYSQVVYEG